MGKVIVTILLILAIVGACGGGASDEDHNDGKCDICGKRASYSDFDEEYCSKHLKKAVEWYISQ